METCNRAVAKIVSLCFLDRSLYTEANSIPKKATTAATMPPAILGAYASIHQTYGYLQSMIKSTTARDTSNAALMIYRQSSLIIRLLSKLLHSFLLSLYRLVLNISSFIRAKHSIGVTAFRPYSAFNTSLFEIICFLSYVTKYLHPYFCAQNICSTSYCSFFFRAALSGKITFSIF